MTGRELIIFILENRLEDKDIFENGRFVGLMTAEEAAVRYHTGIETIKVLFARGQLKGVRIGDNIYIYDKVF